MQRRCEHCGKPLKSNFSSCPYCHGALVLPSQPHRQSKKRNEHVHVVTAPIRKERSLAMSCLTGILIFLPTLLLVFFLMHFYFAQDQLREEQDRTPNPEREAQHKNKQNKKLGEAMEQLVRNSQAELIRSIEVISQELVIISVKPEWNDRSTLARDELRNRWLSKWKSLDGKRLELIVPEEYKSPEEGL